jgi:hypothetical protein
LPAGSGVTSKARFAEYSLSLPFAGFAMPPILDKVPPP